MEMARGIDNSHADRNNCFQVKELNALKIVLTMPESNSSLFGTFSGYQ